MSEHASLSWEEACPSTAAASAQETKYMKGKQGYNRGLMGNLKLFSTVSPYFPNTFPALHRNAGRHPNVAEQQVKFRFQLILHPSRRSMGLRALLLGLLTFNTSFSYPNLSTQSDSLRV